MSAIVMINDHNQSRYKNFGINVSVVSLTTITLVTPENKYSEADVNRLCTLPNR